MVCFGDDGSDEDQLGANYDELEWAMKAKEAGQTADEFEERSKRKKKFSKFISD